ncbi:hypothetical protein [Evansella clarkii]|uniref:hypothetical protein n=1 Tax=Evansella clarkii TaxID=79879 RepID=UPI000998452E|nr:hypothetical protein [Evansella clarkii]
MNNKKWNYLTVGSVLYILVIGLTPKILYDNESTRHLGEHFASGWGFPRTVYLLTLLTAGYLLILRVIRDAEPNKQVSRKTFIKAVFATIGMFLFVMAAQSLRS